jgi:hypothetical protein
MERDAANMEACVSQNPSVVRPELFLSAIEVLMHFFP